MKEKRGEGNEIERYMIEKINETKSYFPKKY